jgi:hypothetical protein
VKNSKDVGNVADIALNVASTADGEANERYTRDAKDKEAVELWRQAAELYRLSVSEATKSPPASRAAYGKVGSRLLFISNVLQRGSAASCRDRRHRPRGPAQGQAGRRSRDEGLRDRGIPTPRRAARSTSSARAARRRPTLSSATGKRRSRRSKRSATRTSCSPTTANWTTPSKSRCPAS